MEEITDSKVIEKWVEEFEIFGKNDLIFRLLPFSFGVLSVILMYLISKRFTKNEIISLVTTSFFAFNWAMISY